MSLLRKIGKTVIIMLVVVTIIPGSVAAAPATGADACESITDGLRAVVDCLISLMQTVMVLLIAASVVYTVYGAFLMISSEEKRDSGKSIIYHGIIGLFVMVSIWGFVAILDNTFNLSGGQPISVPEITPAGFK
jgi:hypothetical protein